MKNNHKQMNVLHLIDTLAIGGAEKVAVNLLNNLSREQIKPFLCITRRGGPLLTSVDKDVEILSLNRLGRYDFNSLRKLVKFINVNNIDILHAHSTSIFIAKAASLFSKPVKVFWHNHNHDKNRSNLIYRFAVSNIAGVFAVNEQLAEWSRKEMNLAADQVWYIPNFVEFQNNNSNPPELPGSVENRIVCVANLRPPKDHINLVRAMSIVKKDQPSAQLLLVGSTEDKAVVDSVKKEIEKHDLLDNIFILGHQMDVQAILRNSSIGVLSSSSEGFPLSLLEYGVEKLAVVVTDVGQCRDMLKGGKAGIVVPSRSPEELAGGILKLLQNKEVSKDYADLFYNHIKETYSVDKIVRQVADIYQNILK